MVSPRKICGEHFANRKEHPMEQILSIYNDAGRTHSLPCKR